MLKEFEENAIIDRLEGWELVEFLQVPIQAILIAARDYDWINEENIEDLLEFTGVKQ